MTKRSCGVLLHPTSLPGRFGVGDLGGEVDRFLDWLRQAGQTWWQILPLGAPETHNSPYACLSALAGNPLLISPDLLVTDGLLTPEDLEGAPQGPTHQVDFQAAADWKLPILRHAWEGFRADESTRLWRDFSAFENAPEQSWLADWTLFAALRDHHQHRGWWDWPTDVARREPTALDAARRDLAEDIAYHAFVQFLFFRQWQRVRDAARDRGIRILGDLPMYVAWNSSEVWARPDIFDLDEKGQPLSVAGVPPDYFSDTGQLWGNPIYRWDRMREEGYAWWVQRLSANLRLADLVRLDHFRAFASFWRVPAGEETAINGRWDEGPRMALFDALRQALGDDLPLVAEDLGDITPDVEELLAASGLPGMRVLQFGFEDPDSLHAVHNLVPHCVVYTGTHDNDTVRGWYESLDPEVRRKIRDYCSWGDHCGHYHDDDSGLHLDLVRLAYTSVANLAIVPLQDILGRGAGGRMNTPAVAQGNWTWRLRDDELSLDLTPTLRRLALLSGRFKENTDP